MKTWTGAIGVFLLLAFAGSSPAAEWFVATNGNDAAEGTNWAAAKLTIQAAIDAATAGDTVWVSNGVYATGGKVSVLTTNRIMLDKPLIVRSVNGAAATIIQGARDPSSSDGLGYAAVRCAYVGDSAELSGFTLRDGGTYKPNPAMALVSGGGVRCGDLGLVTECILISNIAAYGGGSSGGTLSHCVLNGNWSRYNGGGSWNSILKNCTVADNTADFSGGGAKGGTLYNCTVVGNAAGSGGGAAAASLANTIVYGNTAPAEANHTNCTVNYSCTTPDPGGTGNITNDPQFVDAAAGNYRLAAGSPCIDTGDSAALIGPEDLDGHPRMVDATVDMGAYEYQAAGGTILMAYPARTDVGEGAASGLTLGVTANAAWTAATNAPWLAITSGESGTTNGTILFDVVANAGAARTGAIVVAGGGISRTCTVVQAAFAPALAISPANTNVGSGAASGLALGVTANVPWTATTNAAWLAITSGESGTTGGTVVFDVAANAGATRTGAIVAVGSGLASTCTVVQAAFVPALSVSPASTNLSIDAASGRTIAVTANVAWTATTNVPWLAITSGFSGTANGTVVYDVEANPVVWGTRTGAVVVAGGGLSRTCMVVQAGIPPVVAIAPASTNLSIDAASGRTIAVTANVAWTAKTNAPWLAIMSGGSGTTNGTVVFGVASNGLAMSRTGAVVVAGGGLSRTCTVVQAGIPPVLEISPAMTNLPSVATSGNAIAVTANLPWSATANLPWLSITSGASGTTTGTAVFTVEWNAWAASRTGLVVVSGGGLSRTCTVVQAAGGAPGSDWFVATSGNDSADGTTWSTAKLTIQAAIDAAADGDAVWVGSGTYLECLNITKGIQLASTTGPHATSIRAVGGGRCITITHSSATVRGFTITEGHGNPGAGIFVSNRDSLIDRCLIAGNSHSQSDNPSADVRGGGIYGGRVRNSLITSNSINASYGGRHGSAIARGAGAANSTLENCTVVNNRAHASAEDISVAVGDCYNCVTVNCIVWSNYVSWNTLVLGEENPVFADEFYRLSAQSPRINAGSNQDWMAAATDLDGNPRVDGGRVDQGAYEFQSAGASFAVRPASTNVGSGAATGLTIGVTANMPWTASTNVPWLAITSGFAGTTNGTVVFNVAPNHNVDRIGIITVEGGGQSRLCVVVQAGMMSGGWFVATNGNDAFDGRTWISAKQTIQAAVDAATDGSTVWVSNGLYATGGYIVYDQGEPYEHQIANRVRIHKPITVRSVNGPEWTTIQGARDPASNHGCGDAAIRCVYVWTNAVLSGFTLTGGATAYTDWTSGRGGGALCRDGSSKLINCHLVGNAALYGGGVYGGTLERCVLRENASPYEGGGAWDSTLNNCLVANNTAFAGGGAFSATLNNCTVVGNSGDLAGGGLYWSTMHNGIVYGNAAPDGSNYYNGTFDSSCTTPDPGGTGNVTNDPQFVDAAAGNYRLQATSPCLDAGNNAYVQGTKDLDGNPRILNAAVDMGAYERPLLNVQPASTNVECGAASGLTLGVTANVPWTASANVPWLAITSGESGTTNGTVVFDVAANEGASLRAGTIAVTGGGSSCSYTVLQFYEGQSTNGYSDWATGITNGQTNATDCAAGDGVPNLLKYATGCLAPMEPDDLASLGVLGGGAPALTFNRNLNAVDLMLEIQGANSISNGAAWRGVATNVGGSWLGATNVEESGAGNPVECTVTDPVALQSNRFLRLRVTRP